MHEIPVSGEIKTIAAREGSSGRFSGAIEGLYQGYRFGSTTPDEREYELQAPHGTIALLLRQQIVTPLPPRPAKHPFADGQDPFDDPGAFLAQLFGGGGGPPGGHGGPRGAGGPPGAGASPGGGPPGAGAPPGGGPPGAGGPPGSGPPGGEAPGIEGGQEIFKRVHYMETKLHVVPDKCSGIFAGATGDMEIIAPAYRMGASSSCRPRTGTSGSTSSRRARARRSTPTSGSTARRAPAGGRAPRASSSSPWR